MPNPPRKIAFIVAGTDQGMLIVNRFDHHSSGNSGYGVGYQLLDTASYDANEVDLIVKMLDLRRQCYGTGVVAIDCGANIGVQTVQWAKHMTGWGIVLAIEAQERIYYALAGNIAINNCFNARAIHAAVGTQPGTMKIPSPNYLVPGSFGSLELSRRADTEFIGQPIDYSENRMVDVGVVNLDSISVPRIDLIKVDVEGMELDVLSGGARCIAQHHPILFVEVVKSDQSKLRGWLEKLDYSLFDVGINVLAIHKADKCLPFLTAVAPAKA